MSTKPLTRIGKYEVTGLLGRGGMGLVYRAFDKHLGREVAIKTITEGFAGDPEMLERFYREAAKTGMLKHPNIVTVYDLGEQEGFPYIVMEYVAGEALDRVIQSARPLALVFRLKVIEQVCSALAYAHRNDVIHRDVKPANVIVQPDGVAKLLDFGIARQEKQERGLTRTGNVIGTIHYMAPERLRDRAFDGRSDIFSAGIMLYQLLTGQLPFSGEDASVIQKLLNERYPPLSNYLSDYPPALDVILDRSLAKDPNDRYSSADEMAGDLYAVADEVKKGQVLEMLEQAESLVKEQELLKARELLLQVTKLDAQHTKARQLLVQVQQALALRQRAGQIRELRFQADAALQERQYDIAIGHLEEALRLDQSSSELAELLESVRRKKQTRERIEGYLRQADGARNRGDLESAQAIIAKALDLDKEDSRVRAAYAVIVQQVEEAARVAKARQLLESARSEMGNRRFAAAMKLLNDVEQIDPSNPELISLLKQAKAGQEQEQRRRVVEQLQNEISLATTHEQLTTAAARVNLALERMPNEPSLLKFKGQLSRQIAESEARREVDETVRRCRALLDTAPQEALQLVRDKLRDFPGNERLLILQTSVEEEVENSRLQEYREHFLAQANKAISQSQYRQAVRLLETCQADGIVSAEISELLEFARHEAEQQERESLVETIYAEAQGLLAKGSYEAAIRLLEPVVQQTGDVSMRVLLDKARSQEQAVRQRIEAVMNAARELISVELYEEAAIFLESQPDAVLEIPVVQEEIRKVRAAWESEAEALQLVGTAYGALDNLDISGGWLALEAGLQAHPESLLLKRARETFGSRMRVTADQALSLALTKARAALAAGDSRSAVDLMNSASDIANHASLELQGERQQLLKEAQRGRIFSRIGIRRNRSTSTQPTPEE
ncbi:MAG: protein kinase [Candidatus Sulfotelmatobacter sp.]